MSGREDAREQDDAAPFQLLDVTGLSCPLPVLRAKVALTKMAPGERLRVLASDPYSVMDFEAFCDKTGHRLLARSEVDGVFQFDLACRDEDT